MKIELLRTEDEAEKIHQSEDTWQESFTEKTIRYRCNKFKDGNTELK